MTPEMVGASREFVLGKHTGTHSVRKRLADAGYEPTDAQVREITRRVKDYGAEKQRVTVTELERFAEEVGVDREDEDEQEEVRA
jgi:2-isopropylmalate synthase